MKIQNNKNNKSTNIIDLYSQINYLSDLFENIILVSPMEQKIMDVTEYGLQDNNRKCTTICPLAKDSCGCICKDTISTNENKCRFIYNKMTSYLVIGKKINMKYKEYILVLIMRLDTSFAFGAVSDTEAIDQITKLSSNLVIDPLTKIYNRKYLMDNVNYMIEEALLQRRNLCLACIDVDNFKRFNDSYGHEFGDKVLISIAKLMSKSIETLKEAYPIRIGGDEFIIIALDISKSRFKAVMNNLCMLVDNFKLPFDKEMVGIRISIGVSELFSDKVQTYQELYNMADGQLYKAKEAGKGCVR